MYIYVSCPLSATRVITSFPFFVLHHRRRIETPICLALTNRISISFRPIFLSNSLFLSLYNLILVDLNSFSLFVCMETVKRILEFLLYSPSSVFGSPSSLSSSSYSSSHPPVRLVFSSTRRRRWWMIDRRYFVSLRTDPFLAKKIFFLPPLSLLFSLSLLSLKGTWGEYRAYTTRRHAYYSRYYSLHTNYMKRNKIKRKKKN